jgi:sec-independent protein translocase protein TatC
MSGNNTEVQDTFVSHLIELRNRLVKAILAWLVVLIPLVTPPWFLAGKLYDFIAQPMIAALPTGSKMIATGVIAPFFIPLKIAMLAAFMIALPVILYQAWAFVAPGLYKHEKRFVLPLIFSSTLLFFVGMAFCYFFVFKMVFTFIAQLAPASINVAPDIENYFSFVLGMFVAFGVAFETPVVVVVLVATGLVSLETLKEVRRYVIVGAFVVAAVVTPPDVASQLALAIPLCILYEIGIIAARIFVKPKSAEADTADASDTSEPRAP